MQRQILRQMQKKLQHSLEKVQEELGAQVVEGIAGGGSVKVQINGQMEPLSVKIDPSIVDPEDVEMLEDLLLVAIKDALSKVQALSAQKMTQLTGGLSIPGLF